MEQSNPTTDVATIHIAHKPFGSDRSHNHPWENHFIDLIDVFLFLFVLMPE
ncbi:MAG: hypothetical protein IT256_08485 [Chitinophagaceae bacterium]|nr:hypothetical protein [Chitinophagaceae bacterium]